MPAHLHMLLASCACLTLMHQHPATPPTHINETAAEHANATTPSTTQEHANTTTPTPTAEKTSFGLGVHVIHTHPHPRYCAAGSTNFTHKMSILLGGFLSRMTWEVTNLFSTSTLAEGPL
ncbi:hypothetical protein O181_007311 [Austropuccinia psidii MF-1]|uniref:Uncharacterized protein n=1 Tax=Austropuccinia psidii MF-1 TaxID=1389203 RepID=A0A9Q3BKK8_9BASI|nr:hypothetical protein [Austropuccinia psidii MF-1]